MRRILTALAITTLASTSSAVPGAIAQETPAEQRQENRENRQENRQEARQESQEKRDQDRDPNARQDVRQDRREARQDRAQQRLQNRSQYYNNDTWSQLDPWITRNSVTAMERITRAAGAAVGATEKALNTASNIADKADNRANVRYGYINPNGPGENGWFYDYYAYSPTYYNAPATGTTVYGSATRYYDLDNDGVYESLNVFRDSDSNASYDTYDRYDFADTKLPDNAKDQSAEELADSPEDANRHTVMGKVYASKTAKVNGNENLIVRLSEAEAKGESKADATIVDIGPADHWKAHPLQVNDSLTATGPVERVGGKLILIAESVKIGEAKETSITRAAPKMEGQVVDVTTTEVKGKAHTLAVVESQSKRQLVDLGPSSNLKVKVEPQTQIVVQGVPVQVRNHSIVQAERVTIGGQDITIRRW